MQIIQVKQDSGAIRLLAVSDTDARQVERDPAYLDAVTVIGCVDVFRDGRQEWGQCGPSWVNIPRDARAKLNDAARL